MDCSCVLRFCLILPSISLFSGISGYLFHAVLNCLSICKDKHTKQIILELGTWIDEQLDGNSCMGPSVQQLAPCTSLQEDFECYQNLLIFAMLTFSKCLSHLIDLFCGNIKFLASKFVIAMNISYNVILNFNALIVPGFILCFSFHEKKIHIFLVFTSRKQVPAPFLILSISGSKIGGYLTNFISSMDIYFVFACISVVPC